MVPAAFVVLQQLPQTLNGKVDRRALSLVKIVAGDEDRQYSAPRTPLEEVLRGVWAEVLDIAQVSIDDDFFEIGGHSLLAARLISRVRNRLKVEVPLQTLFRSPTPALFAASLLASSPDPTALERIAKLVVSLSSLSDAEVKRMLAQSGAVVKEGVRT
jgi:acyl carrier protein